MAGSGSTSWYDPDRKEFILTTAREMYEFAALSETHDFAGQTIKLGADIIFNKGKAADWGVTFPENVWDRPIDGFAGTFDGQGHTISGIYGVGFLYKGHQGKLVFLPAGLFCNTKAECVIRNFRLVNSYFCGDMHKGAGTISAYGGGTFDSIYSNAVLVSSKDYNGGIIGKVTETITVTNCWYDGKMEVLGGYPRHSGGLIGRVSCNEKEHMLMHCLMTASLYNETKGADMGGLIGSVKNSCKIAVIDCCVTGILYNSCGRALGSVLGSLEENATATFYTSYAAKDSYKRIAGEVLGELKRNPTILNDMPVADDHDIRMQTMLDFDRYWSKAEDGMPILAAFADEPNMRMDGDVTPGYKLFKMLPAIRGKSWNLPENMSGHTPDGNEVYEENVRTATSAIHAMAASGVIDSGDGNFMKIVPDVAMEEYEEYLSLLKEAGFSQYVDNGDALKGYVYTSHYKKDKLLAVVTYLAKMKCVIITVCKDAALSPRLICGDHSSECDVQDARTSLTLPELYRNGSSLILQLKNGHFIINDGGWREDLPYLLDYLEKNSPGGKPVVDAWIISHAHIDHMGIFTAFMENPAYADRIHVEEIYFTEPGTKAKQTEAAKLDLADLMCFYSRVFPKILRSTSGNPPRLIRMRLGERYFFRDITIDVICTPDLIPYETWKTWNASSVVLMYTIGEQKMMVTADMDWECQRFLLECFDDDYFDLAIYQAPHHGGNVYNEFSGHIRADSILYTAPDAERTGVYGKKTLLGRYVQNRYLQGRAKETFGWGDGGIVLTFPYKPGDYRVLPLNDWKYHDKKPSRYMQMTKN